MTIALDTPDIDRLAAAGDALRDWQEEGAPMQLHPGDLGWYWRAGPRATAGAVRTWSRGGRILAVGLLDGPGLVRLTTAPDARRDEELAHHLVADLTAPERGVLPRGRAAVEAPEDALVRELLAGEGWGIDEAWSPLRRDLSVPVAEPGLRIEVAGPDRAHLVAEVIRGAFEGSRFTDERWHAMASGPLFGDARCLLAYDDRGDAVATVTVWSAGPGRPGLLEPMGVHRDHRGRGHGRAITLAAAGALQELGSSSALVCTPSSNTGGVITYVAGGFERRPEIHDRFRSA
ncbi:MULTISPECIES: GNAT family N-acetyltransferase [unclassified Streptomyces]|uniref:GNAT family N-acetyltransferase n=1 Tax=unclassified Streptomyces TaxID=2593676 RepID=UPI002E2E1432|nr:GNAT family N-acetyltransferase [Streptomyces sp. NBC_01423]WSX94957.1 GNAT family N-acetyltransferase [Streptomyces sp. NBC_00891]WSY09437.1 GNAT family N-acetyltransferase [Streptomyces sp. NBC_00890]WSZ11058.1 GNAT family N-acetyltransferase [Streptomyces sp. NBC_00869]WSZ21437.1 GNAT family N-acetyltransferase [Streptomyces sp. NBC_00870]